MWAEFKHMLRRLRGQIIGWGIGLALYGVMMVMMFDTIREIEGITELMASYPPELMAFFGGSMMAITTPIGYLDTYYFSYMPIIVGIFSAGVGAGLLAGDEEKGILDLVLSHPVSRTSLFWGRVLATVAATALILLVGWLSWAIPSGSTSLDITWGQLFQSFIPLFAELLLFTTLALLLSMVLPATRMAGMLTGALLVGNFLLIGLANINENLKKVTDLTPLHYYQGGKALQGINWEWLGGLMAVTILFTVVAWGLFQRRDIRVGGERSWHLEDWKAILKR